MKDDMHMKFELTNMGELNKIVDIEITQNDNFIMISQTKYIESILKKEGMENAYLVKTPMDSKMELELNLEKEDGGCSNSYAQLIGSLMYLATAMRPDIAYIVYQLAFFTANLTIMHCSTAKRVLCYLAGTKNYGIMYHKKGSQFQGRIHSMGMLMLDMQARKNTIWYLVICLFQMVVLSHGV